MDCGAAREGCQSANCGEQKSFHSVSPEGQALHLLSFKKAEPAQCASASCPNHAVLQAASEISNAFEIDSDTL
jgi:hypothetical protein